MRPPPTPEPFDRRRHKVSAFSCGKAELDEWLKRYAGQGEHRDTTRTFVQTASDGSVVGYYTLVVGEVPRAQATDAVSRGTSAHFPIPVCLIARLAVDETSQRRRLGSWLLGDALRRVLVIAENAGTRAVVVDAIDDQAAAFYARSGFEASPDTPLRLMLTMQAVRSVVGVVGAA